MNRRRSMVREAHVRAYRIKRARRVQRRQTKHAIRAAKHATTQPAPPIAPTAQVTTTNAPIPAALPELPALIEAAKSESPFAGGKTLTQNEHKIAEDLHDWILGGQDGVVNLLGTMLGVAVVTTNSTILIVTGLASAAAESLSMAAVAFTSTRASQSFYESERENQRQLIEANPVLQREILIDAYERRGMPRAEASRVVNDLTKDKQVWLEMLMEEHLHLYTPERINPLRSAFIVGTASAIGSIIPVLPFFFTVGYPAIGWALGVSAIVLFGGGAISATITIGNWKTRGLELVTIGLIAALAGFGIGMLFTRVLGVG